METASISGYDVSKVCKHRLTLVGENYPGIRLLHQGCSDQAWQATASPNFQNTTCGLQKPNAVTLQPIRKCKCSRPHNTAGPTNCIRVSRIWHLPDHDTWQISSYRILTQNAQRAILVPVPIRAITPRNG